MNILLLIGFIIGFGGLLTGYTLEDGALNSLANLPALCIVVGGTFGATIVSFPMGNFKKIPGAMKEILFHKKFNYVKLVDMLCEIANKARRDGLLSLESESDKIGDDFIKRGLGYIADGVDPDFLKKVLENEIETEYKKLEDAAKVFDGMGGYSPTMGVLGTVMSMVTVLGKGLSDTNGLGQKIGGAFIATMYGIGIANLIWIPIGSHIKLVADERAEYRDVIIEGLLAIQSGEPSSRLKDRLYAKIGNSQGGGQSTEAKE